jgi:predicted acetyltransferase
MTFSVILQQVVLEEKIQLRSFLDSYLEESSAFGQPDKIYPWFDLYWHEENHWPYWIISENQKIGFTLISGDSHFSNQIDYFLAEFFILPEYRRNGFGHAAFKEIINIHQGQWELAFFIKNAQAEKFWLEAVKEFSYKLEKADKIWVLRFKT